MISRRSSSGPGIVSSTLGRRQEQHVREVEGRPPGSGHGTCGSARGSSTSSRAEDGSPPPVGSELVDLVQHDDRVHRARLGQRRGTIRPGPRAHVGAAVPTQLRLVVHTAQGDAHELAGRARRATDSPSDVLPTPGGPTSARIAAPRRDVAGRPSGRRRRRSGRSCPARRGACAPRGTRRCGFFHVVESGVVGVEDLGAPRARRDAPRSARPTAARTRLSSHVRIQPCSGLCSLVRSSLSISRSIRRAYPVGEVPRLEALAEVVGPPRRHLRRAHRAPCGWRRADDAA